MPNATHESILFQVELLAAPTFTTHHATQLVENKKERSGCDLETSSRLIASVCPAELVSITARNVAIFRDFNRSADISRSRRVTEPRRLAIPSASRRL